MINNGAAPPATLALNGHAMASWPSAKQLPETARYCQNMCYPSIYVTPAYQTWTFSTAGVDALMVFAQRRALPQQAY